MSDIEGFQVVNGSLYALHSNNSLENLTALLLQARFATTAQLDAFASSEFPIKTVRVVVTS